MADQDGTAAPVLALFDALHEAPYAFSFYQAVRRLECVSRDKPRVGTSSLPVNDPVRFAQEPSLEFANATLSAFEPGRDGRPPRLLQRFYGLCGPNGPLPLHLTEYARGRIRNDADATFTRFLDIFHHRLIAFFYRAWASTQPTVSFDRPEEDRFALYVGSTFGLGMQSLRKRDEMPDLAKLCYAGHLSCQTRHAEGLEAILRDFFGIPSKIREFIGGWLDLARSERWRLGERLITGSLGMGVILGARVYSSQHKFRIVMGPMCLSDYLGLLPGGEILRCLIAVVRNYIGEELDWDLNLVLRRDEVPAVRLGQTVQLGWTTWLGEREAGSDADELLLRPRLA